MDLLDDDNMCMPIPANYVSLAQLKERWLKKQEEKRREVEIESESERVLRNDGLVIGEAGKGKEKVKVGSEDGERSKPRKKKDEAKFDKGKQTVKNDDREREVEQGMKNGSENGEEKMMKKKRASRGKMSRGKMYKAAGEKMGNKIGVVKSLEEGIGDGIGIKTGVSEDLTGKNGITSGVKGMEEDLSVSVMEVLPKIETKNEISNDRRVRNVRSERNINSRGSSGRYRYRIKKENGVNERMVKDDKDNGSSVSKSVYRMKANKSKVLDLESKVEELKLENEVVKVDCKIDESTGKGICRDGFVEKSCVTKEYRAEEELSDSNTIVKSEEKASVVAVKSGENGERWGRRNGSKRFGKYNEFEGRSRSKTSNNGMVWVKKGEKFEANASKVGTSGSKSDAAGVHQISNAIIDDKPLHCFSTINRSD